MLSSIIYTRLVLLNLRTGDTMLKIMMAAMCSCVPQIAHVKKKQQKKTKPAYWNFFEFPIGALFNSLKARIYFLFLPG